MAALNVIVPTVGGTLDPPQSAGASDTLTLSQLSPGGVYLVVINGATATSVQITDDGKTPVGHAWTPAGVSVGSTTTRAFYIHPSQVNPSTQQVTITATPPTTVSYHVYPA